MVDACIEKRKQGMDFSHIRKELENAGIDKEEIRVIISLVDSYDRNSALQKASATKKREYFFVGLIAFVASLVMTFVTIGTNSVILFYGVIIGGLSMMGYGFNELAEKFKGKIKFGKVNVGENQNLASKTWS